jgi:peptidyl-prolyl cis-trans isomerase D
MISWMQKHNKYLVWTIWVATIAFIGAGFVGWGSYDLGGKAGNIAKVGEIEISQKRLNIVYSRIYNQYNEALEGQLDEAKAQELGLNKQAFSRLSTQAKILNFANEIGIVISNDELLSKLQSIEGFQEKGKFSHEIYRNYLKAQRLKAKDFEEMLREESLIQKTMALLNTPAQALENKAVSSAMNVSDKVAYTVLSPKDIDFKIEENKLKSFWDMQKENYMHKKSYDLSIVWTESKDSNVTEEELKVYYENKIFNYSNDKGVQLSYEKSKEQVTKDLKLEKSKKTAQKAYIAFKKGKLTASEKMTLSLGDLKLTPQIWEALEKQKVGDILKPKIVADTYATIKITKVTNSKIKSYTEAKVEATKEYIIRGQKEALFALAENKLKEFNQSQATISDFLKLDSNIELKSLNPEENMAFLEKLFTSSTEKGMISTNDKIILYQILEQRIDRVDENQTRAVEKTVDRLKNTHFEKNLIKVLNKKYPTQTYVTGL